MLSACLFSACDGSDDDLPGKRARQFLEALTPSERACVLSAITEDRLEVALASIAHVPRRGPVLPHDLKVLTSCAGSVAVERGISRVVLAALEQRRSRLNLGQEDTPDDLTEVTRRFAHFPKRLAERNRAQSFGHQGPRRYTVVYRKVEWPEAPQALMVDNLERPGLHPPSWTAGELVAKAAFDAGEKLMAAGRHHGVVWARFSEPVDDGKVEVVVWGDTEGRLFFRAEGHTRHVLIALLSAFRSSG